MTINKIYFVWNAEKSLKGAVLGMIEVMRGIDSCTLCDVAYNGLTPKPEWISYKENLEKAHNLEIVEYYRNKLPEALAQFINGKFPAVVGETENGEFIQLVAPKAIDRCGGDLSQFIDVLDTELDFQSTGKE